MNMQTHRHTTYIMMIKQSMMVDPAVLMKGIEEDPSLLEELAALSGGGGGGEDDDGGLKGACERFSKKKRESVCGR